MADTPGYVSSPQFVDLAFCDPPGPDDHYIVWYSEPRTFATAITELYRWRTDELQQAPCYQRQDITPFVKQDGRFVADLHVEPIYTAEFMDRILHSEPLIDGGELFKVWFIE